MSKNDITVLLVEDELTLAMIIKDTLEENGFTIHTADVYKRQGLGILLGGLVGALAIHLGGIPISLSTSGGALIAGLVFGWLRSKHPTFGGIRCV